jgi:hypothetical protein
VPEPWIAAPATFATFALTAPPLKLRFAVADAIAVKSAACPLVNPEPVENGTTWSGARKMFPLLPAVSISAADVPVVESRP